MNRHLVMATGLALSLLMCFVSNISLAQEEEELESSYGIVRSLSSNELVVRESNDDEGEEVDVSYIIDTKVELKNVKVLEDIAVGDSVEIEYVIRDGKKVAKIISVEKET
ncbi:MAG: hypothetical protein Q7J67_01165 [bacterium]|nr:hypothetical protein [bacterium]